MNYYFDTEFHDDGKYIELITIGILSEDGRELYMVNKEYDEGRATEWLQKKVLNHIPRHLKRHTREQIRDAVLEFTKTDDKKRTSFWGWFPAYDWVVLSQLFGRMLDVPGHFPHRPDDLRQLASMYPLCALPAQDGTKHHALEDARWVMQAHQVLQAHIAKEKAKIADLEAAEWLRKQFELPRTPPPPAEDELDGPLIRLFRD